MNQVTLKDKEKKTFIYFISYILLSLYCYIFKIDYYYYVMCSGEIKSVLI